MFMGGVGGKNRSLCRIVIVSQMKDPVGDAHRVDPLATSVGPLLESYHIQTSVQII